MEDYIYLRYLKKIDGVFDIYDMVVVVAVILTKYLNSFTEKDILRAVKLEDRRYVAYGIARLEMEMLLNVDKDTGVYTIARKLLDRVYLA